MKKIIKLITVLNIIVIFLSAATVVNANYMSKVEQDLWQLSRILESETANEFYGILDSNNRFVPSDEIQMRYIPGSSNSPIIPEQPLIYDYSRFVTLIKLNPEPIVDKRLVGYDIIDSWGDVSIVTETSKSPLYAGENTFINNTGIDQEIRTPEFTYRFKEYMSTSLKMSASLGIRTTISVRIPLVSANTQVSANFDLRQNEVHTETTEVTYVSPSQVITVPAGRIYNVSAYLDTVGLSGEVDLNVIAHGYTNFVSAVPVNEDALQFSYDIGNALSIAQNNNWVDYPLYTPSGSNIIITQTGLFSSGYGTHFILRIEDITDLIEGVDYDDYENLEGVLVEEIRVPVSIRS